MHYNRSFLLVFLVLQVLMSLQNRIVNSGIRFYMEYMQNFFIRCL